VIRALRIHQDDLVTGEGGGLTESRQGVVTARTEGYLGFVMEVPSETSLELTSLSNAVPFRVFVHPGFGNHEGSGTTEFIRIVNSNDGF